MRCRSSWPLSKVRPSRREISFCRDELAFDGGLEDGGFVALEVGLDALEVGDGFVEAGELLFDLGDDAACSSGEMAAQTERRTYPCDVQSDRLQPCAIRDVLSNVAIEGSSKGTFDRLSRVEVKTEMCWSRRVAASAR